MTAEATRDTEAATPTQPPVAAPAPLAGITSQAADALARLERGDVRPGTVLALQRAAGNAALTGVLARQAGTVAPPGATAAPTNVAPDWTTQANAQATAQATRTRLITQLLPYMVTHSDQVVRNTAELHGRLPAVDDGRHHQALGLGGAGGQAGVARLGHGARP
ncbi:MAG: hypothetical protein ACXVSE_12760 [Solirubrobacteraceae bacterium]